MPPPNSRFATTASQCGPRVESRDRQAAINAMTAEACALNILSMSTLTSGEYDFISKFVGPVMKQQSPMIQSTLEDRTTRLSSVTNRGDGDLEETTRSEPTHEDKSTDIKETKHAAEAGLLTEESLNVHWHEPLMEGLLAPIIDYLRSEGVQIAPKEGSVTDRIVSGNVSRTICLRDIEVECWPRPKHAQIPRRLQLKNL